MIIVWIILIVWGIWLLSPIIGKWLRRLILRNVQKHMYRSMGIDPSAFQETKEKKRHENRYDTGFRRRPASRGRRNKIIPAGYGEYIKFTTLALTGNEPWLDTKDSPVYVGYKEVQITDARWVEIK